MKKFSLFVLLTFGVLFSASATFAIQQRDFNGDGKIDILWRNYSTGENRVWFLDGLTVTGTAAVDTVTDLNWVIAGTGDFNGDGKADILWRHIVWGEVGIWLMDGTTHVGSVGLGPVDLLWVIAGTGDFNGDGKTDLLWRHTTSGDVNIWLMDGTTHTGVGDVLLGPVDLLWVIVGTGDFNGDGKTDILWLHTAWSELGVWLMDGTTHVGGASLGNIGLNWQIVGTGDFNGDGKIDILERNPSTGANHIVYMDGTTFGTEVALPNETDQNWKIAYIETTVTPPPPPPPPTKVVRNDFNSDGKSDILWRNYSTGENRVWLVDGATVTGTASVDMVADLNWIIAGTGDFNGDGKPDIIWRHLLWGEVGIWLMNGTAHIGDAILGPVDLLWVIAGTGDFDGDGKTDILMRNTASGEVGIWLMDGVVHIGDVSLGNVDLLWQIVGTGDFNGDGKVDILMRNTATGEVGIRLMDGTVFWGEVSLGIDDPNWTIVGTGDFNGDGKIDILRRNYSTGENAIWYMDGTTIAGAGALPPEADQNWMIIYGQPGVTPPPPVIFIKNDFNGDGKPDILWRNTLWGEVGIWMMDGTTHTGAGDVSLGNVDLSWQIAGTGDFNGDGKTDILWRNTLWGEIGIWLMDGTVHTGVGDVSLGNVDLSWQIAGTGDFNGDGKTDIMMRNTLWGEIGIWIMDGTTHTGAGDVSLGNVDLSWQIAATGDFNGDGKIDILMRNTLWGEIGIWIMDGTTHTGVGDVSLGNVDLIWQIAGTGDYNGDGKIDIMMRNTSWGEVGIWIMDGTAHVGDVSLGNVDLIWQIARI